MAKKPKVSRQERTSQEEREQREMLGFLREEVQDLHNISVIEMGNTGVLPPFYAGRHMGEEREVLPLWAIGDVGDDPELGALLLRVSPGVEPNPELEQLRNDLE